MHEKKKCIHVIPDSQRSTPDGRRQLLPFIVTWATRFAHTTSGSTKGSTTLLYLILFLVTCQPRMDHRDARVYPKIFCRKKRGGEVGVRRIPLWITGAPTLAPQINPFLASSNASFTSFFAVQAIFLFYSVERPLGLGELGFSGYLLVLLGFFSGVHLFTFWLLPRILWCWVSLSLSLSFARAFLLGRLINFTQ